MGRAKTGWVKIGGVVVAVQAEPALEFGGQNAPEQFGKIFLSAYKFGKSTHLRQGVHFRKLVNLLGKLIASRLY